MYDSEVAFLSSSNDNAATGHFASSFPNSNVYQHYQHYQRYTVN